MLRYAAGFVVRNLLNQYSTKKFSKAYEFVDCLEGMINIEMDDPKEMLLDPTMKKTDHSRCNYEFES